MGTAADGERVRLADVLPGPDGPDALTWVTRGDPGRVVPHPVLAALAAYALTWQGLGVPVGSAFWLTTWRIKDPDRLGLLYGEAWQAAAREIRWSGAVVLGRLTQVRHHRRVLRIWTRMAVPWPVARADDPARYSVRRYVTPSIDDRPVKPAASHHATYAAQWVQLAGMLLADVERFEATLRGFRGIREPS